MSELTYYSPVGFCEIYDIIICPNLPHLKVTDIEHVINITKEKSKVIIYCSSLNEPLEILFQYLPYITCDFVLITCMEDSTFPNDYNNNIINSITNNKHFKHWFLTNKIVPNNSYLTPIPYGLDYWTMKMRIDENITYKYQDIVLNNLITNSKKIEDRIPKIYATWNINTTDGRHGGMRQKLPSIIPSEIIYYQEKQIPMIEYWQRTSEYAFVVSPFGNGYDCIRTFEALCLGCIVIMKKCFLLELYHDLPVMFVDNWEDINQEILTNILKEFKTRTFNMEKLKMKYWTDLIFEKMNS